MFVALSGVLVVINVVIVVFLRRGNGVLVAVAGVLVAVSVVLVVFSGVVIAFSGVLVRC